MKKDWLLLLASVVMTLLLGLGMIRWLAPDLLATLVPVDRRVVQLADEVAPFFEGVFPGNEQVKGNLINDPYVGHRRARMVAENSTRRGDMNAPFDLLGFRNRSVPVVADVVAIGDSQTVGPNATYDRTWPSALGRALMPKRASVYNISVGGWGAVQYLYMFDKALAFQPRVVVVAFYTGNDPVDSLYVAYQFEVWESLRAFDTKPKRAPSAWPPKKEDSWPVTFADGVSTVLTPKARLAPNDRAYPGTVEGYRIMGEVGRRIAEKAEAAGVQVVFTIIPTKEMVYREKVRKDQLSPPAFYTDLMENEGKNIEELAARLTGLPASVYVDLVTPLQQAALKPFPFYPASGDGHPLPGGYALIARTLAPAVDRVLPSPPEPGLLRIKNAGSEDPGMFVLIKPEGVWRFSGRQVFEGNGWKMDLTGVPVGTDRDVAGLPFRGVVSVVNPQRFGPPSVGG